jgi:hypothetical protein
VALSSSPRDDHTAALVYASGGAGVEAEDVVNMTRRWLGSVADDVPRSTLRTAPEGTQPVPTRAAPWPPPLPVGDPIRAATRPTLNGQRTTDAGHGGRDSLNQFLERIFLVGLAGVFLANAAVAWVEPAGFTKLVHESGIGRWLGLDQVGWLIPLIGVNDLVVGTAVLGVIWSRSTPRRLVLAWAGLWLLAVTMLKLTAL